VPITPDPDPTPHCPDSKVENWINAHGSDAATVANNLNLGTYGEADILGLSAIESGWGDPSFTNAFFGMHGKPGQPGCVTASGDPSVCVMTFPNYLASAQYFASQDGTLFNGHGDPSDFAKIANGPKAKFGWIKLANGRYGPNPKYIPGLVATINAIETCIKILGH
jgi:hypothetical protein